MGHKAYREGPDGVDAELIVLGITHDGDIPRSIVIAVCKQWLEKAWCSMVEIICRRRGVWQICGYGGLMHGGVRGVLRTAGFFSLS